MNPFDIVNDINYIKKGIINDEVSAKEYNAWIVNRALSYFPDTIFYAQEMNTNHTLDNKMQYDYLFNAIRPAKRFSKWGKKDKNQDIEMVQQYFGYSRSKALIAMSILTPDQMKAIGASVDTSKIL